MEGFSFVTHLTGLNRPNTGKEDDDDDDKVCLNGIPSCGYLHRRPKCQLKNHIEFHRYILNLPRYVNVIFFTIYGMYVQTSVQ
jgi:hypothetical protein